MAFGELGINIGTLTISYFALIVLFGLGAGWAVSARKAAKLGEDISHVADSFLAAMIVGLLMSRLFYVWSPPPSASLYYDRGWYLSHLFNMQVGVFAIWNGGLGLAGMMVGASLAMFGLIKLRRLDAWRWADILMSGILTAAVIMPIANFVNQQLYGPPTTLFWGMAVRMPVSPYNDFNLYPPDIRFHPTMLYMALWAAIALAVTWWRGGQSDAEGQSGRWLIVGGLVYLPGLFLAEFLRVDVNQGVLGLTAVQAMALAGLGSIGLLAYLRSQRRTDRTKSVL